MNLGVGTLTPVTLSEQCFFIGRGEHMFEESAVFHAPTSCAEPAAFIKKYCELSETEQSRSLNSKTDGSPRQ